ncbi:MAG: ABC transporter ATP-binding protein, partial [Bauldia sp.]|nr:ABC transporter ATP-binding protein [Bauldia sp.]
MPEGTRMTPPPSTSASTAAAAPSAEPATPDAPPRPQAAPAPVGGLDKKAWSVLGRLLRENFRDYAARYALVFLLMGVMAATTGLLAWILRDVVNQIFVERNSTMLWVLPTVVIVASIIKGFAIYGSGMTMVRIGNSIVARMQSKIYSHVLKLGMDYFSTTHSSELITRLSHNANAARDVLNTVVTSFGRDLLTLIALLTVMIIQAPIVTVAVFIIGPIIMFSVHRLSIKMRNTARQGFAASGRLVNSMQESVQGIRVVKAFNLEEVMQDRMTKVIDENRERANRMAEIGLRTNPISEALGGVAIGLGILWGGYAVIELGHAPGSMISFIAALLLAYEPAKRLARTHLSLTAGLVGVGLMYDLLDIKPTLDPNEDGPELAVEKGEVRFEKVDFAYRKGEPVFKDFDFVAEPGKMTALVGRSGSGKSTLMALIERFYDPQSGHVLIDGQDVSKVKLSSVREQISLVSQDVYLFSGTIKENIALGRPDAPMEEIERAAKFAMAHDFIMATPKGYDTAVGENGLQLSGGQRQRISIARAMLRDARVVLLDEATSSLDTESEQLVQVAFEHLMKGRTTIVIAHRLSTILNADKICVMNA